MNRKPKTDAACKVDLPNESVLALCSWAEANGNVQELWLFGSRARGEAREDSDVDLALALMPPTGKTNWALGNYFRFEIEWKRQLEGIVRCAVSIEPLVPGEHSDERVRREGVRLWARVDRSDQVKRR
jgi:predicted nucleotidyltransferase